MAQPQKISTCLWFDRDGEEAANFYVSLFANSRVTTVLHYGPDAPLPEGTVLVVNFELAGTEFMALNGGPVFPQSEAVSLVVKCDTQAEIDDLWAKLTADGGAESQCFWLKDRFGVSWQIVPAQLGAWMTGPDKAAAGRVMAVVMDSVKADIAALEKAFKG
jgi:predicted 3-demethylubiquinone-9 3-methyltransferase (glyoxalase superfamily)